MKQYVLLFCLIALLCPACVSLVASSIGLNDTKPEPVSLQVKEKQVVFLGIMHLAKKEYYSNLALEVAKYNEQGFVAYLEGKEDTNNVSLDTTAFKKLRKINNIDFTVDYANGDNSALQIFIRKYDLIAQPKYEELNVKKFLWADVHYLEQINRFESQFGVVRLDSCDLATPLGGSYKCESFPKSTRNKFKNEIAFGYRNQKLAEKIINSPHEKILVIYGIAHLKGLKEELEKQLAAAKK